MIRPLRDQKAFIALYRSRHRCQTDWFSAAFHFAPTDDPPAQSTGITVSAADRNQVLFLGFVLPKKLIKRAVDRNQVKRWVRAGLQQVQCAKSSQVVIRPRSKLVLRSVIERTQIREDLLRLIAASAQKLQHGG